MLNRLILKVTKFQLPPAKRLGTVVKNILRDHHGPMSNRVNGYVLLAWFKVSPPLIASQCLFIESSMTCG